MAAVTFLAVLSLTGVAYAFLDKQSISVKRYVYPLFSLAYGIISTRSACSKSPMASILTWRLGKFFRAGLCDSFAILSIIFYELKNDFFPDLMFFLRAGLLTFF